MFIGAPRQSSRPFPERGDSSPADAWTDGINAGKESVFSMVHCCYDFRLELLGCLIENFEHFRFELNVLPQ